MDDRLTAFLVIFGFIAGISVGWLLAQALKGGIPYTTYSNLEEWEIIKDEVTGRVKGVKVHRTAKNS